MGAMIFSAYAVGDDPKLAFYEAVNDACYEHGHGGYTGTIAEKMEFVMIEVPAGEDPGDYAEELIKNDDPRIRDKWGPAGCVRFKDGFLFFGWASS